MLGFISPCQFNQSIVELIIFVLIGEHFQATWLLSDPLHQLMFMAFNRLTVLLDWHTVHEEPVPVPPLTEGIKISCGRGVIITLWIDCLGRGMNELNKILGHCEGLAIRTKHKLALFGGAHKAIEIATDLL